MEQTALKAATGSGTQQGASRGSVAQPAGGSSAGGTPISQVQPVVAASSLVSQEGIRLSGEGSLPHIDLGQISNSTVTKPVSHQPTKPHQVSPALIALPVILVLIAVVAFWQAQRSVKNTTGY